MAKKWVCDTCLVTNDIGEEYCSCCGSSNNLPGTFKQQPPSDLLNQSNEYNFSNKQVFDQNVFTNPKLEKKGHEFQQKVKSEDDKSRVRLKYTHYDLKHTSVFVVGSSEIDQLPHLCCDKSSKPGSNELVSMYECSLPTPILTLPKFKIASVSCGALHTALLTSSGCVYTFGCNDMGALGRLSGSAAVSNVPDNSSSTTAPNPVYFPDSEPTMLDLKFKVKKVTCGDNHTLLLSYNGGVYFTGCFMDSNGPIGVADYNSYESLVGLKYVSQPVRVPCEGTISDISSGENHCVLLCQGGNSLYTFGSNEFSQLMVWEGDVQNPLEGDVDLTVESNLKLLLTWPQSRKLTDILAAVATSSKNTNTPVSATVATDKPHDVDASDANANDTPTTAESEGSLSTKSAKASVRKRKTGTQLLTEAGLDLNSLYNSGGTKRSRTHQDVITQIFTGYCTTFFQTKSLRLYGVGRNAQGEVGVGAEDLVIKYPTELVFFRGVELTSLCGGQFFTMALVSNCVFIWGKLCYLAVPNTHLGPNEHYSNYPTFGGNSDLWKDPDDFVVVGYPNSMGGPYDQSFAQAKQLKAPFYARRRTTGQLSGHYDDFLTTTKKRKLDDDAGLEMDKLDVVERLLRFDYTQSYDDALRAGKATSPLLLAFKSSVKTIFCGSDSLFLITYDDNLYSWGSSQNYILANGKDVFYQNSPELVPPSLFPTCKVIHGSGGSQHTVFLALKRRVSNSLSS